MLTIHVLTQHTFLTRLFGFVKLRSKILVKIVFLINFWSNNRNFGQNRNVGKILKSLSKNFLIICAINYEKFDIKITKVRCQKCPEQFLAKYGSIQFS